MVSGPTAEAAKAALMENSPHCRSRRQCRLPHGIHVIHEDGRESENDESSDDVQLTTKQLCIVGFMTSPRSIDDFPPELWAPTALAVEKAPVVSSRRRAPDDRPPAVAAAVSDGSLTSAIIATVVPLAPAATRAACSVAKPDASRSAAPPPPGDDSDQLRAPLCAAAPLASAVLAKPTTHPASASGGGADGLWRAAVGGGAAASPPAAAPAAEEATLVSTQLRETRRRLDDELARRAEPRALVDARCGVLHAATAAVTPRLTGSTHRAERRRSHATRRSHRTGLDQRPHPEDDDDDGLSQLAAAPVDAAPSYCDAASPPSTAPSPTQPTPASAPSSPTEREALCCGSAVATASRPRVVASRISRRRSWRTETMRSGCFYEVLLLVVCALTLLGPYFYARGGGAVRAAPLPPPPSAAATAPLAAAGAAAMFFVRSLNVLLRIF